MITSDGNIPFQQNLAGRQLSIVVVPTNRLSSLRANAAALQITLDEIEAQHSKVIIMIDWSGRRTMRRLDRLAEAPEELTPVSPYSRSGA